MAGIKKAIKTLVKQRILAGSRDSRPVKNKKSYGFRKTLENVGKSNDSGNLAMASRSHSQDAPRWPSMPHRANTVKSIGKSTFPGAGGGATRSRKWIHLGVAGKSYGFRKIIENHWKNNISRNLARAAKHDFLPAMTLARIKKSCNT